MTHIPLLNQEQEQEFFHARDRRRSLAGIPKLHRTHRFAGAAMAVAAIDPSVVFADVNLSPVTFRTVVRFPDNTNARSGTLFEFSDAAGGVYATFTDTTLIVRAGSVTAAEIATGTYDNVAQWPAGLEFELVVAIRPGSGEIRVWGNGQEILRAAASGGDMGTVGWHSGDNGSFAAAVNGAFPAGVSPTTAPVEFAVTEALSVYTRQVPQHFTVSA